MINEKFSVEIDDTTGFIKSIVIVNDKDTMNWCAENGNWGKIHITGWKRQQVNLKSLTV